MTYIKRSQVITSLKIGLVFIIILIIYAFLRFIPGVSTFLNIISRYIFILCSSFALIMLSLAVIYKLFKEKEWTNLGRALFGLIAGIILGMIIGDQTSRMEISKAIFTGRSILATYLICMGIGISISELVTLTRRTGHYLMVFLCSSISWILLELLSTEELMVNINWLLAFLFGIAFDQLFRFKNYSKNTNYSSLENFNE